MGFDRATRGGGGSTTKDGQPASSAPGRSTLVDAVQRKPTGEPGTGSVAGSLDPGGLPGPVRGKMEHAFGADFSSVKVRESSEASAIGAQAFTRGNEVVFAPGHYDPGSERGQALIGHELAHVVQQSEGRVAPTMQAKGLAINDDAGLEAEADALGARAARGEQVRSSAAGAAPAGGVVQRRTQPEDVAVEMIGKEFTLSADDGTLRAGTVVKPTAWDNASDTVPVQTATPPVTSATVHKTKLRPVHPNTPGINSYSANIDNQAAATEAGDAKVDALRGREAEYARNHAQWEAEMARLQGLEAKRHELLNRRLIQETQFNRFDPIIKSEVDAANTAAGFKDAAALDPNLIKAMIFQESQMGTSGEHLGDPSHPVKTRFNLGQTIDSSGSQLLLVMEREYTALISQYHLGTLRADLEAAKVRKQALEGKAHPTPEEVLELQMLVAKSAGYWETYIWQYRAAGQTEGFWEAVTKLFQSPGPGQPPRNEDYQFWIHLMVMWIFEKKKSVATWEEAVRAYNGSGPKAQQYRTEVTGRRDAAKAAGDEHRDYVPDKM
jgi:hypothetical protein